MSRTPFWIFTFLLAVGFVDPIPLYRIIREVEDYQNIEAAYTNYTANEVCFSEMHVYQRGDVVPNAGPCEECRCEPPSIVCQMTKCPVNSNGCRTIQKPNHCCPDYNCDCEYGDRIYNDGERIDTPGECQVCYCKGGEVMCTTIACYTRDDCEPIYVAGQCCPTYQNCPVRDPNGSNGEEKAVPKREMQPWLLTKIEPHTAPPAAFTSASHNDISSLHTTGLAETSLSENTAGSYRDNEATSAKPLNNLDEVVFTRVENNNSAPKLNLEHLSERKSADQMNDGEESATTDNTETTLVDLTTTKAVLEGVTNRLENIEDLPDVEKTTFSEFGETIKPTEISVTEAAKIIEERLFLTTTGVDEDTSTTVKTLSRYTTIVDEEVGTTEHNLESTTKDKVDKGLLEDVVESIQILPKIDDPIKKYAQDPHLSTENLIMEETTLTPTTTDEPTYTEIVLTTDIHSDRLFKHSTESVEKFIISDNSLLEPKNDFVVEKKISKVEFPPEVITNSVEYLTTIPSVSKLIDPINQEIRLKEIPKNHETTQSDELFTTDFTTMIVPPREESSSEINLDLLTEKKNRQVVSEKRDAQIQLTNEGGTISVNNLNASKIMDNVENNNEANEQVGTWASHPVEVEIVSNDEDEDSTSHILLDASESDEDEEPLVIDIVHQGHSNENTDRNVPPILELNSHVPFLQLGEDSSEETTENEGLVSSSTSAPKPERLLQVDSKSSFEDVNVAISGESSTTTASHVSSTPVIPLTPGDLKALAEFMIKEKIKPADEKNNSMYRPNQWLEGNLTSEENISSIMSAASVTVGLMNRTGSEKSIVPFEALKNKSAISNLSELSKKHEPLKKQSSHVLKKVWNKSESANTTSTDSSKIQVTTTINTLSVVSSVPKENYQLSPNITKSKEVITNQVSTPIVSEKLLHIGEAKDTIVLNISKEPISLSDDNSKADLSSEEVEKESESTKNQLKEYEDLKRFESSKQQLTRKL